MLLSDENVMMTYPAGVDYKTKIISLDEENIKLQIW